MATQIEQKPPVEGSPPSSEVSGPVTLPASPPPSYSSPDSEQQRREQAIKRIRDKNAFMLHLVAYLVINAGFVLIWAISGVGYFWPIFVMLGWGAGVAIHGYCVYGGETMSEERTEREMQRLS